MIHPQHTLLKIFAFCVTSSGYHIILEKFWCSLLCNVASVHWSLRAFIHAKLCYYLTAFQSGLRLDPMHGRCPGPNPAPWQLVWAEHYGRTGQNCNTAELELALCSSLIKAGEHWSIICVHWCIVCRCRGLLWRKTLLWSLCRDKPLSRGWMDEHGHRQHCQRGAHSFETAKVNVCSVLFSSLRGCQPKSASPTGHFYHLPKLPTGDKLLS